MAQQETQESRPNLTFNRREGQAQYFVEEIAPKVGMEMLLIPGGEFTMGSPDDEVGHQEREAPQHQVQVPTFFMGKYSVTQAQWRAVARLPEVQRSLKPAPSRFKGDNHPVEQVSWDEAVEFCDRLTQNTGRPYRLPSEAEWEYACRAGTTTPFHFGETITTDCANYRGVALEIGGIQYKGSYGQGSLGEYRKQTTPVDKFGVANAYGLCDLHGNVWEWCLDSWHETYDGAPIDGSAWEDDNDSRILRGGSWVNAPEVCRSACRDRDDPGFRSSDLGFRFVLPAPRTLL